MTKEELRHWQAECREVYGIGTRIARDPRTRGWTVEHDPDECCGQEAHDPYTREGACHAHYPFGASAFCLRCTPVVRCSEAARFATVTARKAAAAARKAAS